MSGMTLNDDGTQQYSFVINAIGTKTGGFCGSTITVGLYTQIKLSDGLFGVVTIKEIGYTFRNLTFNDNVLNQVGEFFK